MTRIRNDLTSQQMFKILKAAFQFDWFDGSCVILKGNHVRNHNELTWGITLGDKILVQ
jgi:hypothetical protein